MAELEPAGKIRGYPVFWKRHPPEDPMARAGLFAKTDDGLELLGTVWRACGGSWCGRVGCGCTITGEKTEELARAWVLDRGEYGL